MFILPHTFNGRVGLFSVHEKLLKAGYILKNVTMDYQIYYKNSCCWFHDLPSNKEEILRGAAGFLEDPHNVWEVIQYPPILYFKSKPI